MPLLPKKVPNLCSKQTQILNVDIMKKILIKKLREDIKILKIDFLVKTKKIIKFTFNYLTRKYFLIYSKVEGLFCK